MEFEFLNCDKKSKKNKDCYKSKLSCIPGVHNYNVEKPGNAKLCDPVSKKLTEYLLSFVQLVESSNLQFQCSQKPWTDQKPWTKN